MIKKKGEKNKKEEIHSIAFCGNDALHKLSFICNRNFKKRCFPDGNPK